MRIAALDDLDGPAPGVGDGLRHLGPLIPCIRKDAVDEGKQTARCPQHLAGTIAILHVGGVDDHAQQEAERIDEDVALASLAASKPCGWGMSEQSITSQVWYRPYFFDTHPHAAGDHDYGNC